MRRRAGVGAIQKQRLEQEKYREKGSEIQENQFQQMSKQLDVFRENLEEFASKHKNEIKKNAQFRRQFQEMCAAIGVDPLASGKGFWSVLGIGDFYYELGVQIVEVCLATNYKNGGLITLDELRSRLIAARGRAKKHQDITNEDLLAAVKKLKIFGNGFTVVSIGKGKWLVQSIPGELNLDQTLVLQKASGLGKAWISKSVLINDLGWNETRAQNALNHMVKEGLAWVDSQDDNEILYWFPSMFNECVTAS
ncbi:vacuolar-sorting protein SNF8 [Danaus plexippus]|uniref:Vacuolar-sorting protein SNF8 n=1 Tax=Danaus plexippus plexippus TaxID=278856 RepID=A0A212EWY2_DANPL|nr:vacuolar-sorting protein SNF8 [Danaus plexippus]OWR45957.1 ELL complex EAP30 subunit [Danaus plexippus plexippus]